MSRFVRSFSLAATLLLAALLPLSISAQEFLKGDDGGFIVPAGAETLFYSGSINFAYPEGCSREDRGNPGCMAGDMEAQGTAILLGFKNRLDARGWSLQNVVRMNVYGVAGEDGTMDSAGFNRAYAKYFQRGDGGWTPARTFIKITALFDPALLVEVEIVAMKVPN